MSVADRERMKTERRPDPPACGSACCIAGLAIYMSGTPEQRKATRTINETYRLAGEILGLDAMVRDDLFEPTWLHLASITEEEGASAIGEVLAKGRATWELAGKNREEGP